MVKTIARPPGCHCGDAEVDCAGRVLLVRTCPICMGLLFDSLGGTEYAVAYLSGEGTDAVLLKQKEFFSFRR